MFTIIVGVVCLFVGWNLPQPALAKAAQAWLIAKLKTLAP